MKDEAQKLQSERIEKLALKLYDELNPRSDIQINVSKAECIRRATKLLNDENTTDRK